jgi:hypothetical protein
MTIDYNRNIVNLATRSVNTFFKNTPKPEHLKNLEEKKNNFKSGLLKLSQDLVNNSLLIELEPTVP